MKKTSFLMLSSLLLNVWGSAAVEVDLGSKDAPESTADAMGVVRKTGCNPSHPSVAKAFETVLAKKIIPISKETTTTDALKRFETRLSAYHAQAAAASVVSKVGAPKAPKAAPVVQLLAVEAWPSTFVYDQRDLGSCTANSMAFIVTFWVKTFAFQAKKTSVLELKKRGGRVEKNEYI